MVGAGYSIDSIVDAFELSKGYKLPKLGETAGEIVNDKPEVDEGNEVSGAPDRTEIDGVTPVNATKELHCSSCDRFLGETTMETYIDKIKCGNSACKALEVPIIKEKHESN